MLGDPNTPLYWKLAGDQPDEQSMPTWCAFTGQNEMAARDWGWLEALHSDDRQNARNHWKQGVLTPRSFTAACRILHFREGYQAFKVLGIPVFNLDRHPQNWLIFFTAEPADSSQSNENWEIKRLGDMIFTQTALGIFFLSLDGSILRVNERFCQLTGYTEAELLRSTLWQLCLPEDLPLRLRAMYKHLTNEEASQPFRTRYLHKDGSSSWARMTPFLVRQPTGEPYYFFFLVEDIQAQIQAEEERSELLTRFQEAHIEALGRTLQLEAIFEAMIDGIVVCDRAGNIIQSNSAVVHILHLENHQDFLQLPLSERAKQFKIVDEHGQTIPGDQWPLARILQGETLHEKHNEDIHLFLPDGSEIYINHTGTCIRDENQQIIGGVLVIHDVSERHILESRIQKAFKILLALAEELVNLPERALQRATTGQLAAQEPRVHPFQMVSEYLAELTCQMLEYRGVTISLLVPGSERMCVVAVSGSFSDEERAFYYDTFSSATPSEHLKAEVLARLNENEATVEEFQYRPDDARPYKVLLAPMIIDGRLAGILTVEKKEADTHYSSDEVSLVKAIAKLILLVIERERMQREWIEAHASELALREANKRFDEFLSIASHELRTPLAGIKGNIQLALRRLATLKSDQVSELKLIFEKLNKVQEYLLQAEHRVNVQNRMLSDLLDISRIQANKLELVLAPCDLFQVVYEAVKDQQYTAPERVITLNTPENLPIMVTGDADRLGQVTHNYLTNALKYSPPDLPVAVRIEKSEGEVSVSVQDQGPGLTPEEQARVWERFYRVKDIPALGGGQGLGLGLHICRTIIEAHRGKFGLDSLPGKGSTFWFTLPLAQSPLVAHKQDFPHTIERQPGTPLDRG